eukprot:24524-Eustigmatos_ZCMA.PRE.1
MTEPNASKSSAVKRGQYSRVYSTSRLRCTDRHMRISTFASEMPLARRRCMVEAFATGVLPLPPMRRATT